MLLRGLSLVSLAMGVKFTVGRSSVEEEDKSGGEDRLFDTEVWRVEEMLGIHKEQREICGSSCGALTDLCPLWSTQT